ncbi:glutathione transferase [Aureococcus anophagefferens]|nr:glutathione transferase [Aureococcus anophagefferens]
MRARALAPTRPSSSSRARRGARRARAARAASTSTIPPVTVGDFSRNLISLLDGGVRESIAKRYARSLTLSINDDADRAVEVYNFSFSYPSSASITVAVSRAQHVALDKKLTFFATVLPETTSAAASFTLKMAFNSTAPAAPAGRACDPRPRRPAAVPNSIKLILGAVQGPRACELTYRGVQPSPSRRTPSPSPRRPSGCFDLKLSDSLKDDDETQLDSARISPPKKKRRRAGGPPKPWSSARDEDEALARSRAAAAAADPEQEICLGGNGPLVFDVPGSKPSDLILTYFAIKGLGEVPRLLLAEADVAYISVAVQGGEAPDVVGDWRAKSPNGLLPIATGLGVPRSSPISQSSSIIRFLARHFKLDGGDDEAIKVRADVLFETAKDLGAKASEVVEATGAGDAETAAAKEAAVAKGPSRWPCASRPSSRPTRTGSTATATTRRP